MKPSCNKCVYATGDCVAFYAACDGCGGQNFVPRKVPFFAFHAGRTKDEHCIGGGFGISVHTFNGIVDGYYLGFGLLLVLWYVNISIRVKKGAEWLDAGKSEQDNADQAQKEGYPE